MACSSVRRFGEASTAAPHENGRVVMSDEKLRAGGTTRSITPQRIRAFTAPVVRRGYDRDAVDGFLNEVAATYEVTVQNLATTERRMLELEAASDQSAAPWPDRDGATGMEALQRELRTYRERELAVAAALVVAQQAASELRSKAEKEVEAIRTAAAADVEALRSAAKEEAESIVLEARLQTRKIEEEASSERTAYEREVERLRSLKEATRQDLSEFLTQALRGLQEPGDDDGPLKLEAKEEKEAEESSRSR
jgi:DivIVA domain-containing protein